MENKNEMVVSNNQVVMEINNGIGNETKVRKYHSVDVSDKEKATKLINTMTGKPDHYIKDCVGKVIEVESFLLTDRDMEYFNEETGESGFKTKHVLVLFDVNGESYLSGSYSFYNAFNVITSFSGIPSVNNVIKLAITNIDAGTGNGHKYLSCEIVTD